MEVKETSTFSKWIFPDAESAAAAQVFTGMQRMWIQTCIATAAEEKVRMAVDPNESVTAYQLRQEYLRGQIEMLQYLLEMSAAHILVEVTAPDQE